MKKLLSLILSVIMAFNCCVMGTNVFAGTSNSNSSHVPGGINNFVSVSQANNYALKEGYKELKSKQTKAIIYNYKTKSSKTSVGIYGLTFRLPKGYTEYSVEKNAKTETYSHTSGSSSGSSFSSSTSRTVKGVKMNINKKINGKKYTRCYITYQRPSELKNKKKVAVTTKTFRSLKPVKTVKKGKKTIKYYDYMHLVLYTSSDGKIHFGAVFLGTDKG